MEYPSTVQGWVDLMRTNPDVAGDIAELIVGDNILLLSVKRQGANRLLAAATAEYDAASASLAELEAAKTAAQTYATECQNDRDEAEQN